MNTKAIRITAALLGLTACNDSENPETETEAIATLYALHGSAFIDKAKVKQYKITKYRWIQKQFGAIEAKTTDGKTIYTSAYTIITHK